jgi:hypothetical protein
MKVYIKPIVELINLQVNKTLCASEQPSASPTPGSRPGKSDAPVRYNPNQKW